MRRAARPLFPRTLLPELSAAMEVIKLKTAVLDRLTDAEFFEFCQDHRDLRIERDAAPQITIMPPPAQKPVLLTANSTTN